MLFACFLLNSIISLRSSLRNANLQAKANMRKAAQEEVMIILSLFSFLGQILAS